MVCQQYSDVVIDKCNENPNTSQIHPIWFVIKKKKNQLHPNGVLFPGLNILSLTKSLKKSISYLAKPFPYEATFYSMVKNGHSISMCIFTHWNKPCVPWRVPFSIPLSVSRFLWGKSNFLHCLNIKICRNHWIIIGSWDF